MPRMPDLAWISGAIIVFIYLIYILGSRLVDRYFKKTDELDLERQKTVRGQIDEIKRVVDVHSTYLSHSKDSIHKAEIEIVQARKDIQSNTKAFSSLNKSLAEYIRETDRRLRRIEKSKLKQIGPDTWIITGGDDG